MADESDVVQRTTTIFIIYLVLHSALVLISLYALCGVNNSCLGRRSFGLYFVPWIMIWIAIIVLDIAATVFFSLDAVNAQVSIKKSEISKERQNVLFNFRLLKV